MKQIMNRFSTIRLGSNKTYSSYPNKYKVKFNI